MISELKLNLACGQTRIEGFFGIDIAKTEQTDAVMDLEQFPWDIESESATEIVCSHYVEHIPHDTIAKTLLRIMKTSPTYKELFKNVSELPDNLPSDGMIKFMNEVYRILKPDGTIKVIAPYYNSIRCWQDPTHTRAINEATFLYFNKEWRKNNGLDHYGIVTDFDFPYGYDINNTWLSRSEEAKNFAINHYMNVINDIHVVLSKKVR